jgi:hypothetical protein
VNEVPVKGEKTMRSVSSVTVTTAALATTLIWSAAPTVAGPVCNELDLRSPCIRSNDIRANIVLGGATGDARLRLRNEDRANAVDLQAGTGNLTNLFSNEANASNGLVKAWAQIDFDGTVIACWRCNTDPAETRGLGDRAFEVDFTPLSTDIRGRPRSAAMDGGDRGSQQGFIRLEDRSADASSVFVETADPDGAEAARSFVLIIY